MPIVSALLLQQAVSFDDGHDGDDDDSARTNRVDFVHQIMHGKDSRVQARGWGNDNIITECYRSLQCANAFPFPLNQKVLGMHTD